MADQDYEFIGRVLAVMRTCATFPIGKPFGCSDVAEKTGMPKNTAWRILKGLAHHNYIRETVTGGKFFRPR